MNKRTIKRVLFLIILWNIFAYSDTNMITMDNDAFAGNGDGQYTGGLFYTWMSESNNSVNFNFMNHLKTNNGISFEHLIFTPNDKRSKTPVLNEIPYAGYAKLNFLLYKSSQNHFHEFGVNFGLVGPITRAKELQSEFHTLIGHSKPDGWDTQLENQPTLGISYNYAQKTTPINFSSLQFDWTNNARFDIGNFYSGGLIATAIRIGSNFPNTFPTTGNFIDGDESSLINFYATKDFNWAISLGVFANKVYNYYIIDEAIKQGYDLSKITYFTGEQVTYDIFYNNLQYTFKIKSIYTHNNKVISSANKQWGGITVIWKF